MTTLAKPLTRGRLIRRALRSHPPSASGWPSAIRRGVLVGLIVLVGAAVGEFGAATIVAIGALNIGLIDLVVSRRLLVRVLISVTGITAVIVYLAAGLAGSWWVVALLMALAYLTGAIGSAGVIAFNTTFMALVTGVLFTNTPGSWAEAFQLAVLVLFGSLLQCVSTLLAWRYERELAIRRALVNLTTKLRLFVLETTDVSAAHLHAANAQLSVEGLLDSAELKPDREWRFRELIDEFNWTRFCLSNWVAIGSPTAAQRNSVAATLSEISGFLEKSVTIHQKSGVQTELSATSTDPPWQTMHTQLTALKTSVARFGDRAQRTHTPPTDALTTRQSTTDAAAKAVRSSIWGMLKPGSVGFRHAMRLTVAVGTAEAIVLAFSIERGYWIVLTVVMVVRPDFSTTLVRGILRVLGTAAAVVVSGTVFTLTHDPQWLMGILVLLFAPLAMRWMTANYAFVSFAMGITVLLLIEGGEPNGATIWLRLENTLIGALIGLAAYVLWPRWNGDNVRALLLTVVDSQQHWTGLVVQGIVGQTYDSQQARSAGVIARNRMLTARPAVEAAIIEPHRAEVDVAAALAVLNGCAQAAIATLVLEVQLKAKGGRSEQTQPEEPRALLHRYLNADFDRARLLIENPAAPTGPVSSESTKLANRLPGSESQLSSGWHDQSTARAVNLLITSADATLSAARVVAACAPREDSSA